MKWGVAWRNIKHYVKHDLEGDRISILLAESSSLCTRIKRSPGSSHSRILFTFTRERLTKEDWKKAGLDEQDDPEVAEKAKEAAEPSLIEELALAALAARVGAEHIKPVLQRIYMTRASAYQEGVAEVMNKKAQHEPAVGAKAVAGGVSTRPSASEEPRKDKMPL